MCSGRSMLAGSRDNSLAAAQDFDCAGTEDNGAEHQQVSEHKGGVRHARTKDSSTHSPTCLKWIYMLTKA